MIDFILILFLCLILVLCVFGVLAFWNMIRYKAPTISSGRLVISKMVTLADLKPGEKVIECGAGFGGIVFEVLRRHPGVKVTAYEIQKPAVWWMAWKQKKFFPRANLTIQSSDFFRSDLSSADVIFCYLLPEVMDRFLLEIYPKLRPKTRIISHAFSLRGLDPQKIERVGKAKIWVYEKK
jgi:cyclopropane fatty-acyl-phospholipid synthase-like methyltransferase